jgi:Tol biopolymer transport system component
VAYVSYPDGTLSRSKPDGSQRLQLTYRPLSPHLFRWSPDSKTIVFTEKNSAKIYELASDGGSPRQLMPEVPGPQWDPNWSPTGDKIVFGGGSGNAASSISILNLASHQVSTVPGSRGRFFFAPMVTRRSVRSRHEHWVGRFGAVRLPDAEMD